MKFSSPLAGTLVLHHPILTMTMLVLILLGWLYLVWMTIEMDHPLVQLTMPMTGQWHTDNVLAILLMWTIMMAAMMLPSALPMVLGFVHLAERNGQTTRAASFVAAYLVAWFVFSSAATLAQWLFQSQGWIDPMIASRSTVFTAVLLMLAGVFQFSPLKHRCLTLCRTPLGFLIGEWRNGTYGAFVMGWRHGLFCLGCCWALMVLLFVGGAMNLPWMAALSIAVAIEKILPHGERLATLLGIGLIITGLTKFLMLIA